MFYDVVVKYQDEPKERIAITCGADSSCLKHLTAYFENNTKLEYIKLEMSTFWRNKNEHG